MPPLHSSHAHVSFPSALAISSSQILSHRPHATADMCAHIHMYVYIYVDIDIDRRAYMYMYVNMYPGPLFGGQRRPASCVCSMSGPPRPVSCVPRRSSRVPRPASPSRFPCLHPTPKKLTLYPSIKLKTTTLHQFPSSRSGKLITRLVEIPLSSGLGLGLHAF